MTASERIREARLKQVESDSTPKQIEVIGMLHSTVEDLDYAFDGSSLIFTGHSADGPCAGYIFLDGTIDWIVGQ